MTGWRRALALGLLLAVPVSGGWAQPAGSQYTLDDAISTWTVAPDGTSVVDAEVSIRAPRDNPTHVVRIPLFWLGATETLRVTEARIEKPDGREIVLGDAAVRDDPLTGDQYFHEFSGRRRLAVTFADVERGDRLVVHTRREVFRTIVPGGFAAAVVLNPTVGWTDTNYIISVPSGMPLQVDTRGFDHQSEIRDGRTLHYFQLPKDIPSSRGPAVLSEFDRLSRFTVSTFKDWDQFARAYASVLLPHAAVTPAIAIKAAMLTQDQASPLEEARMLYEWVRDNVKFIPIPLEESRPEPNDAEQVMTKLYGDTKDHAVLLYALLSAQRIEAEIVLLNASNSATIAGPPVMRPMNHLVVFLPHFNIWLDSTTGVAPFGVLPFQELGKPAIHLTASGAARGVVPIPPARETRVEMKTEANLDAAGNVTGTTTTTASGAFGVWLRSIARSFGQGPDAISGAAATVLRGHGEAGTGEFFFDPPTAPSTDYSVRGTFQLQNKSALLHGGFFAPWVGLRILPRPGDLLAGPMLMGDLGPGQPTFCYPGIQREEISLTLPEGREPGKLPEDNEITTGLVHFRSHWTLDGRRVTVVRAFKSVAPGPLCEGAARQAMATVLTKVRADLNTLVGLKVNAISPAPPATDVLDEEQKN